MPISNGDAYRVRDCPVCDGTGWEYDELEDDYFVCSACGGDGFIELDEPYCEEQLELPLEGEEDVPYPNERSLGL